MQLSQIKIRSWEVNYMCRLSVPFLVGQHSVRAGICTGLSWLRYPDFSCPTLQWGWNERTKKQFLQWDINTEQNTLQFLVSVLSLLLRKLVQNVLLDKGCGCGWVSISTLFCRYQVQHVWQVAWFGTYKCLKIIHIFSRQSNCVSVDTVRVLDLAGDSGLVDGGRGVPQQEAVA